MILNLILFVLGILFGTIILCALAVAIAFAVCCAYTFIKGFVEVCHNKHNDNDT